MNVVAKADQVNFMTTSIRRAARIGTHKLLMVVRDREMELRNLEYIASDVSVCFCQRTIASGVFSSIFRRFPQAWITVGWWPGIRVDGFGWLKKSPEVFFAPREKTLGTTPCLGYEDDESKEITSVRAEAVGCRGSERESDGRGKTLVVPV